MRGYYQFNSLDVDRYEVNGREQQVVLAARELNPTGLPGNTWENRHLAYTHGYGVAFAPASEITTNGQPDFLDTTRRSPIKSRTSHNRRSTSARTLGDYAVVATKRSEISYSPSGQDPGRQIPGQRRRQHGLDGSGAWPSRFASARSTSSPRA